jgi:hypothetical protein
MLQEPVLIEAFIAKPAIEALDIGVLDRLARSNECEPCRSLVRPGIERLALELGAVVHGDRARQSA